MPSFIGQRIQTDFIAAGGTILDDVPDLVESIDTFNVEQPDQEQSSNAVAITSRVASQLTARRVIANVLSDGSFEEWRLNRKADAPLGGKGTLSYVGLPPIFALAECGVYYTTGAGGIRSFSFSLVDVTVSTAMTSLVLGTPDCPSWVGLGTIDAAFSSLLITIEGEFATPLAIWFAIRDAVRSAGLPCEARFRRNGTSQYLCDLVTQVGSAAAIPEVRASKQMKDYLYANDCTRQATKVFPRGPVDATGFDATLARARFKVTAVNGGTKRLTVADEAGGAGPIKFDDQYVSASPAGWFVFRERTGKTFQIVRTYKATQEIELSDVSDFAAHAVTAPEWIGLRVTEALTGTRRIGKYGSTLSGALSLGCPYMVTVVNGGLKRLTLANQFTVQPSDPVCADGEHVDWLATRATPILSTASTNQTAGVLTCGSVAGVLANDICIVSSAALPTATMFQEIATVVSVNGGANQVTLVGRYSGITPGSWGGGPLYVYFYRPVATTHLIRASAAAGDTIDVDAVGTAAANDIIETITQPCQGTMPFLVESPADITSYGKKITVLGRKETGETDLVANSCMRTWTNAANPPDGWTRTVIGGTPTHSQENTITRQGGHAWRVELARNPGSHAARIFPLRAFPHPVVGATAVSVRLKAYIPADKLIGNNTISFTVRRVDRAGNVLTTPSSWVAPSLTIGGPTHSTLPEEQKVELDNWIEVAFEGLDITYFANEGVDVAITGSEGTSASAVEIILDGVQITQTQTAPRAEPELLIEFSEATKLLQSANLELVTFAGPPVEFSMSAADIEAVDPTLFSEDKISLGGTVRAMDADRTIDLQLRLMQWTRNNLDPRETQFTLATLPQLLSDLIRGVSGSASAGGSVTASAVAIGGASTDWAAITGKPSTFPPTDHSHYWRDILSETAGEGPRVGIARFDSTGDTDVDVPSGSPGPATILMGLGVDTRKFIVVTGQYNNADAFTDVLVTIEAGATIGIGVVFSGDNLIGTSKPRTYANATGNLTCSIGGGGPNTYKVRCAVLSLVPAA